MLIASLAFVGGLIGALIGVIGNYWSGVRHRQAAARDETRIAARLARHELHVGIAMMGTAHRRVPPDGEELLSGTTWETVAPVLARGLDDAQWSQVALAFECLKIWRQHQRRIARMFLPEYENWQDFGDEVRFFIEGLPPEARETPKFAEIVGHLKELESEPPPRTVTDERTWRAVAAGVNVLTACAQRSDRGGPAVRLIDLDSPPAWVVRADAEAQE